jgi:hypothetical protein
MLLEQEVPHKIVFLDIDGVLNGRGQLHIDLTLATRLGTLVHDTGAEIVLSSMWRLRRKHRRAVRAAFLAVGLPRPIGYTPMMHYGRARAAEIMAWLRLNSYNWFQEEEDLDFPEVQTSAEFNEDHYFLPSRIWVSHYVVLDDLDLLEPERGDPDQLMTQHHFVRTLASHGLTEHNAEQARQVLSAPSDLPKPIELMLAAHCDQCAARLGLKQGVAQYQVRTLNKFFCNQQCAALFVY